MGQTETDTYELPPAVVEELLASNVRCRILSMLSEEGEIAVADLVDGLLAGRGDQHDRTRLRDDLFERQLPPLTATGVVEYNSQLGTVTLRDQDLGERATQIVHEQ